MNFITLKELKKMVPVVSEFKRVPGLKKILEDGIEVILRKQMENHAEVVVYSQDNAASTKPVNSRKGFYLDDIVGTFGVPVEEHRKESEVKQMDGYVSMGILTGKIAPEAGKD